MASCPTFYDVLTDPFEDYTNWWDASTDASYSYLKSMRLPKFDDVYTSSTLSKNRSLSEFELHKIIVGMKKEIGKELIESGVLVPHRKLDKKSGAYIITFETKVSEKELGKLYIEKLSKKMEIIKRNLSSESKIQYFKFFIS